MVLQIPGSSWLPSRGLPGAQTPRWRKNHHRAATDPTALRAERQAIGAEAVQGRAGRHHSAAAVRVNKNKGTRGTWEVQSVVNCGDTKNQQSWSLWVGGEASCWSLGRLLRNPKKCIASAFFRHVNRIKEDVRRFFRLNFGVWFSTLRSYLAAQLALAEAITCCVDLDRRAITCRGPDYDAAVARGFETFWHKLFGLILSFIFFDFDVSPIITLGKNNWCSPGSWWVFPIAPGTCIHVALGCEVHEKWPGDSWGRQSPSLAYGSATAGGGPQ